MSCRPTTLSSSDIYCCNSTWTHRECEGSGSALPKCSPSHFACLVQEGGGCCPLKSLCSPNGCIMTTGPTIISSLIATSTATFIGPVTVTEIPAATATIIKQGEVAQSGVGAKDSVVIKLCLPYSCISFLVFVAAVMGFL